MINQDSYLEDALVGIIANEYLRNLNSGRRVRFEAIDVYLAKALVARLRNTDQFKAAKTSGAELVVAVLGNEKSEEFISAERAIGFRNREASMLLFVPNSLDAQAESLVNAFDSMSMVDLFGKLVAQVRERISLRGDLGDILRSLPASQTKRIGAENLARFWLGLEAEGAEYYGRNLNILGLIPDFGRQPWARVLSNRSAIDVLQGKSRPLSTLVSRIQTLKLADGSFKRQLEFSIEPHMPSIQAWLDHIALGENPEVSFDKWQFADEVASEISTLEIEPFIDESGKVSSKCNLRQSPGTGVLYASTAKKLGVNWLTKPLKLSSVAEWLVEIAPPDSLSQDYLVLREMRVKSDKRRALIPLELIDEELEGLAPRYVVRVSALDSHGAVIKTTTDEPAIAESQEFAIEDSDAEVAEQAERNSNANSLAEACLRRVVEGKSIGEEAGPSWDLRSQVFSISNSAFNKTTIRISRFIVDLQRRAFVDMRNPKSLDLWIHGSSAPENLGEALSAKTLELPGAVTQKREAFLKLLSKQTGFRDTVETAVWTPALSSALQSYLASYKKALSAATEPQALADLLALDTVRLSLNSPQGIVDALVLLPINPIRASWVMEHDRLLRSWAAELNEVPKKRRSSQVEARLLPMVSPANLPLMIPRVAKNGDEITYFIYNSELTHGSAVYFTSTMEDTKFALQVLNRAIDLGPQSRDSRQGARLLAERLLRYTSSHETLSGLKINLVNPGDGGLGAEAIRIASKIESEDEQVIKRFDVCTFGKSTSFINPVPELTSYQRIFEESSKTAKGTYLAPAFKLRNYQFSQIADKAETSHISVVQDFTSLGISVSKPEYKHPTSLRGLINPTQLVRYQGGGLSLHTIASLGISNTKTSVEITNAYAAYSAGVSRLLGDGDSLPALQMDVDEAQSDALKILHESSDWVCTIDKHLGLSHYDLAHKEAGHVPQILDYAPDFVDGLGERLTVTTTNNHEVERILAKAMETLGLKRGEREAKDLLGTLASVSGRLALRLLKQDNSALEAIGLAATVTYLKESGLVANSILVPIDAHPDLFGVHSRDGDDLAQRCDLMVVRFTGKTYTLEFIEVKARTNAIEAGLPKHMAGQIRRTIAVVQQKLGLAGDPRVDDELQWARWMSLLRFYAERSLANGYINDDAIASVFQALDRIQANRELPKLKKSGYIFALSETPGSTPNNVDDMQLVILDANKMQSLGFTTIFDANDSPAGVT